MEFPQCYNILYLAGPPGLGLSLGSLNGRKDEGRSSKGRVTSADEYLMRCCKSSGGIEPPPGDVWPGISL